MTIKETAKWLADRDQFLILTHSRPDGDTLGSAAGLCQGLREMGKTVFMLENPETTIGYNKYIEKYYAPEAYVPSFCITVDTASTSIFQINGKDFIGKIDLCIDHHPSNTGYTENICLDYSRAACGEIVFDLLKEMSGTISAQTALPLYIAVSTDTGCFSYGNTNGNTLRVAAALVEAGAPNRLLNKELFQTKSKKRIFLENQFFAEMEYYFNDTVAIGIISKAMIRDIGVGEGDMDDIAALPRLVEGVVIGVTIRENANGCKISVRSQEADADVICALLGGGGHKMAAGCVVNTGLNEAKKQILTAIERVYKI